MTGSSKTACSRTEANTEQGTETDKQQDRATDKEADRETDTEEDSTVAEAACTGTEPPYSKLTAYNTASAACNTAVSAYSRPGPAWGASRNKGSGNTGLNSSASYSTGLNR